MKKITVFCAILFIAFSAFAQRPVTILGAYSCGKLLLGSTSLHRFVYCSENQWQAYKYRAEETGDGTNGRCIQTA